MKCASYKQYLSCFLVICSFNHVTTFATIIATRSDSTEINPSITFDYPVNAKVYDRTTGTIYLAMKVTATKIRSKSIEDAIIGDGNTKDDTTKNPDPASWYLAKAIRPIGNQKPQFTDISSELSNSIDLLALASEPCDNSPYLAFVEYTDSGTSDQQIVSIIKNDGTGKQSSDILKDASEVDTCGIVAIAANKSFIFAAVTPGETDDIECSFGAINSGIAVVSINPTTLALNQTDAEAGTTTIRAKKLDLATVQVKIANNVTFTEPRVELLWDHQLQRLYIGLSQLDAAAGGGAKAVVVARVSQDGVLTFENIAPDTAFAAATDNIVGIKTPPFNISIKHVRIMHCSTGPSYLIVNGGYGASDEANNKIFALPLIDINPADPYNGTLADKNSDLVNHKFDTRATTYAQLPTATDPAAQVGSGPLPIQADIEISDMVVVGDTVYVSINTKPDALNDSGVFYSQALFDETGKIVRWTPWSKRALPFNAFPNTLNSQGQIKFFDVDAVTGKLWAVEGTEKKAVCSTTWDLGTSCNSLPTELNNVFTKKICNKECFSVLDLDQATRGFTLTATDMGITTTHRYALFGGTDTVIFSRISTAYSVLLNSPQTVIQDFSMPENFSVTNLEPCSGDVTVLEYSRTPTTSPGTGYFFAGTQRGLFVSANDTKQGFNVTDLKELNQPPFTAGKWYYIKELPGSIVDIRTLGNRLYIITFETSCQQPFKSRLYGISFTNNLDTMFAPTNLQILAESGVDIFSTAQLFTGLEVVATGPTTNPLEKEQVILATNNGLFRSCADQVAGLGMISITNQTDAKWQRVPSKNTTPYWSITSPDAPIPSTVWPITIDDKTSQCRFDNSSIEQLSITSTTCCSPSPDTRTFIPHNFNALSSAPAFQTLDPITHFWSDGARRFFVTQRPQDPYCLSKLLCLPYNNFEWCIINPGSCIIFDPVVLNAKRFNWVHQIGASGILMAGTDSGVIALE